jgi:hypothetical protein
MPKPKITAKQEGGDDGYCYVVRINGVEFIDGLTRREVPYYKQKALEHFHRQNGDASQASNVPRPGAIGRNLLCWQQSVDKRGRRVHKATGENGVHYSVTEFKTPGDAVPSKGGQQITHDVVMSGKGLYTMAGLHVSLDDAKADAERHHSIPLPESIFKRI